MSKISQLAKFVSSFQGLTVLFLISGIFLLLKYAIKRRRYSHLIPSRNKRFIDVWGDFNIFPRTAFYEAAGLSLTAVILQYLNGLFHLYKNEVLFSIWIGYTPFICLNKPEAVEEVLGGRKINEKAWFYDWLHCWLGTGLLTSHGQKWKSRRRLLTPAFHFDILKDFLPVINERSRLLVKILEEETTKDYTSIVSPITLCSLDIICQTTLGVDINCQENKESEYVKAVVKVSDVVTKRITNMFSWFDFTFFLIEGRGIKKDLKLLHDFTMSVIREKKRQMLSSSNNDSTKKRKALMDLLLQHHIETKELSEEDIREEVDTFAFEGHDTTSMAMSWTLYFIGLYKDVQEKIHEELDEIFGEDRDREITTDDLRDMNYLDCVLKESLRLCPSVPVIARKANTETNICGYQIPKGASLVMMPYNLHRNEEIYPNPEVFDPNRFTPENSANRHPYAYIPFSAGSRNCIGQRFAIMEEKVILANLLRNYKLESLDPRDKMITSIELILRSTKDIRIKIRPR
ncbi:cytochrome P450 4V2 [Parasteatoda tepidariorum]|uniref:cytochrome P450 4V2 n=1 Tax=Parasteatoda tepidariorum TaxID=114398 RepID=UPI001C71D6FE|nr:cytochrome P450 4V2 [Parasteatoda tepidariorum]